MNRNCKECGHNLKGRSDKKFCDSNCRSAYNNRNHQLRNNVTRTTIKILKRNRQILWTNYTQGYADIKLTALIAQGFKTEYLTRQTILNTKLLSWCFDMAYAECKQGVIIIYSMKETYQSEERSVLI